MGTISQPKTKPGQVNPNKTLGSIWFCSSEAQRSGAGAMKDFQILRKEIQISSEGIQRKTGRKSKENWKEIQAFVFRGSSLFKDLRRPRGVF
jgi:hypothetical protein